MLKRTERIPVSFRISSVLFRVEPDLHTGSDQKVPTPDPHHWLEFRLFGFIHNLLNPDRSRSDPQHC